MGIAHAVRAQSNASSKALLNLLTLPPVLPPRSIIIARPVLAFDCIFTGVDRPAYMAFSKLPLVDDGRFRYTDLLPLSLPDQALKNRAMTINKSGMPISQISVSMQPRLVLL